MLIVDCVNPVGVKTNVPDETFNLVRTGGPTD